jgi:hypothetical protein
MTTECIEIFSDDKLCVNLQSNVSETFAVSIIRVEMLSAREGFIELAWCYMTGISL